MENAGRRKIAAVLGTGRGGENFPIETIAVPRTRDLPSTVIRARRKAKFGRTVEQPRKGVMCLA